MASSFLGEIRLVGFNYAPIGWVLCSGQTMPISEFPALYAIIGTAYGGDGIQTFCLPNLNGTFPIGAGSGPNLPEYDLGDSGGAALVTLSNDQLPAHTHIATIKTTATTTLAVDTTFEGSTGPATSTSPKGNYLAASPAGFGSLFTPPPGNAPKAIAGVSGNVTAGSITGQGMALQSAGQSVPLTIQPPFLGLVYILSLEGDFPT